jgi:hypothetical protein
MGKRSTKTWNNYFIMCKGLFLMMEELWEKHKDEYLIKTISTALRNPIVFDNNLTDTSYVLPYVTDLESEKFVKDHLVGISNIVLYIYENKLYRKWDDVETFKLTLKSLQVLLYIPKTLNNSKGFKGWQFEKYNIGDCIKWNDKLKRNNIFYLYDEHNNKFDVDVIWYEWYESNKENLK